MDNNIDTTEYGLISGIYFRKLLKTIIDIGEFNQNKKLTVLDFGAGKGELKKLIKKECPSIKVINYDIKKEFSEIEDWKNVKFDIIVCNEVFYTFEEEDLFKLMKDLKKHNQNLEMIVGISRASYLNKIGIIILNYHTNPFKHLNIIPKRELEILSNYFDIIAHKSVFCLADIYRLKFKK